MIKKIKNYVKSLKFKDDAQTRMLKTFIQAFVSTVAVEIVSVDFTGEKSVIKSALYAIAISGVAAGLSAVMNLEPKEETEDE